MRIDGQPEQQLDGHWQQRRRREQLPRDGDDVMQQQAQSDEPIKSRQESRKCSAETTAAVAALNGPD
ncbi:unnamed protein product [Heligmosomoides polygyrus]|uniref:Uncharacterized protein n=1 Tax=Heligmosomoides polygyrus TaxID=6339 RepID=A0A183FF44_HELPZ|nr:unnamed protein product [Heligmosomoides polygyrus]